MDWTYFEVNKKHRTKRNERNVNDGTTWIRFIILSFQRFLQFYTKAIPYFVNYN